MFFRNTKDNTYQLALIFPVASTIPQANRATPPDACPSRESGWTRSWGMRKPVSTIIKARTGAQTIGSLIVSASLAAKTEADDLGEVAECSPSRGTGEFSCGSLPVDSNVRSRIVTGTTVRLIMRLAIAIGMALSPPNRSPRTAGPTKGTAGAEAVSAYRALTLVGKRKIIRWKRNTTP